MHSLCDKIEKFGKGIGNTSRYRILEALRRGPRTVGQIVKAVKMSQPAVSQHLKTLKACGLVHDQRQGQEVFYFIDFAPTVELLKLLVSHLNQKRRKTHGLYETRVAGTH